MRFHRQIMLFLLFLTPLTFAKPPCPDLLTRLMTKAKESGKARTSQSEIAPELKPLISAVIKSGTRTREQHQALAKAVQDYLRKNGVKSRTELSADSGIDIIVEEVSKDSPFTWAFRVPKKLTQRHGTPILGLFNTDVLLNPYTPGIQGGSAMFRYYFFEDKGALVYSAKSLMSKRFHASSDGHEAIHAVTTYGSTPKITLRPQRSKLEGKAGADLYGRQFSSDEIHSAYPFSIRTILKDVEAGKSLEPETADALSESDMTTLRNELIQALYQTVEPSYLEALKPGVITSESIRDSGGFEGDRSVVIKTSDNTVSFAFQSEQVNRWKLQQDPSASRNVDWSKDPETVRAMLERDYLASKKAVQDSKWLVDSLTGPNPPFSSYREATKKLKERRDSLKK